LTFTTGHVHGGTGAGRKRPLAPAYIPWQCDCEIKCDGRCGETDYTGTCDYKLNPGYLKKCIDCGVAREDGNVIDLDAERKVRRPQHAPQHPPAA
jgi:hypothetical protein